MADNRTDKGMIAPTEKIKRIPDADADDLLRQRIDALERDRDVDRRTWNRIFKIAGTIGALITFLIMLLSFVIDQLDKLR